ncbi:hypothetical protein ABZY09_45720 [Streptomyces sp. NPDC002928]|uniref:hypothetical protein n=1 Tax=Streptomyces sp. NPDC002928 TaxID=3154440 RepID=UPI0033BD5473
MTTLSVPLGSAAFGVPIWLAVLGTAVLAAIVLLCAGVAVVALNRTERADVAQTLLGLSHVISALCGLLPWGRPSSPPPLPARSAPDGPAAEPVVQEGRAGMQGLLLAVVSEPAADPAGGPAGPCPLVAQSPERTACGPGDVRRSGLRHSSVRRGRGQAITHRRLFR